MHPRSWSTAALAAVLCWPMVAHAATDADLAAIRDEIRLLKESYEARIDALEARLRASEAAARPAVAPASTVASPSASAAAAPAPSEPAATPAGAATSGIAAFNPAVSVVLQGRYANLSQDPDRFAIAGFPQAGDLGPGTRGLSLAESEITFSANVDDRFAGNLTVALAPDNSVAVEEAYGFMPSLGKGVVPEFGRFFSGIGYLNEQHQHVWDFVDAPLAYQAFLGGQLAQDGVQLKWVAPTDLYVEVGGELGGGDAFPGGGARNGVGLATAFAHVGGDIGDSHSWRAGVAYAAARPRDRGARQLDAAGDLRDVAFSGNSDLVVADFVWKYAPHGNARETSVKLQAEYLWRREHGTLTVDPAGLAPSTDAYAARARGGYVQAVWQFMPAWRVGARYDVLSPGSASYGVNADLLDLDFTSRRTTAMLDWTPSEFSRVRLQLADSRTRPGVRTRRTAGELISRRRRRADASDIGIGPNASIAAVVRSQQRPSRATKVESIRCWYSGSGRLPAASVCSTADTASVAVRATGPKPSRG